MQNGGSELQPIFAHAEPVLAVHNISATILYWQHVLGFPNKWTSGQPPTHGGIMAWSIHTAFLQSSTRSRVRWCSYLTSLDRYRTKGVRFRTPAFLFLL